MLRIMCGCFVVVGTSLAFGQDRVKDSTLHYEILMPEKWHISQTDQGEMTITSPKDDVLDVFLENVSVYPEAKALSLEEHHENHIKDAYENDVGYKGFKLLEHKLITINGKRAFVNRERFSDGSKLLDVYLVTMEGEYFFYQIVCASLSHSFDDFKEQFTEIYESFSIDERTLDQETVSLISRKLGIPLNEIPKVPETTDN